MLAHRLGVNIQYNFCICKTICVYAIQVVYIQQYLQIDNTIYIYIYMYARNLYIYKQFVFIQCNLKTYNTIQFVCIQCNLFIYNTICIYTMQFVCIEYNLYIQNTILYIYTILFVYIQYNLYIFKPASNCCSFSFIFLIDVLLQNTENGNAAYKSQTFTEEL